MSKSMEQNRNIRPAAALVKGRQKAKGHPQAKGPAPGAPRGRAFGRATAAAVQAALETRTPAPSSTMILFNSLTQA